MADNEGTGQAANQIAAMTEVQIAALPTEMQAAVRALIASNTALSLKVKEKDPTWEELAKYGKGVFGVKVSKNGALQFTGTRKTYGGFYLFAKEIDAILGTAEGIKAYMSKYHDKLSLEAPPKKEKEKGKEGDTSNTPDPNQEGAGNDQEQGAGEGNDQESQGEGETQE